jgi:hypothetical protein
MTENDVPMVPSNGQWVQVDPQDPTTAIAAPAPKYVQAPPMKAVETLPTEGIVLDQKVFVALVLLLGAIAGIVLMLILDKYSRPAPTTRARAERDEPRVTLEYTE